MTSRTIPMSIRSSACLPISTLIAEAHRLGIRVMIDLVLSHTSDQHPWFVESRSSRFNPKADWYVWADSKPDGTPPNNWLSIFGGSAWAWDPTRLQYYMHNFLTSQPDLNLHNLEVQDALLAVERFWLERGVDGFRLDTINFYFHDLELRDNPALAPERRNANTAPAGQPVQLSGTSLRQEPPGKSQNSSSASRAVMDEFPAIAAVGEVGDSQIGLEIAGQYTSGNDKMHMCYAFEFLAPDPLTPAGVAQVLHDFARAAPEGWACWAFSNHDVVRHVSRWGLGIADHEAHAKFLMSLLMTLRGSVCIYQGEELGLTEADLAFEGSAGSLRHPVLAGFQGPRRVPHPDGLGQERRQRRLRRWQALATGAERTSRPRRFRTAGGPEFGAQPLPAVSRIPQAAPGFCQGRDRVSSLSGAVARV
ncbi:hypothetical protein LP421_15270 [Rhizobium sp. RCAM05350]|nr:hypothetical protein LP421_15270 [Rhizobium sp. RCAM05350]